MHDASSPHRSPPQGPPPYVQPGGSGVILKERPFVVGLILTIVTLGIYPLFWHYLTHDELSRQRGVPNRAKTVWVVYIVLFVANLVVSFALPGDAAIAEADDPEEVLELLATYGLFIVLSLAISFTMLILYVVYVGKQWETLRVAKGSMALAMRGSAGQFFLLYFGGIAIALFFFWLIVPILAPLIMIPIAYYQLNQNYNDIAAALRTGQVDGRAFAPGGAGGQRSADPAHQAGAAPGHAAAPVAYGQPTQPTWLRTDTPNPPVSGPERAPGIPWDGTSGRGSEPRSMPPPQMPPDEREMVLVEQAFQCPKCHTHVTARGAGGEDVTVHCARCGESGMVRMPVV